MILGTRIPEHCKDQSEISGTASLDEREDMSKVEVIVAAMNQDCMHLHRKMNIQSDMLIANQTDYYGYEAHKVDGHNVRMISTTTRGVGINRNLGIQLSQGEILLFADEDNTYTDSYLKIVEQAFEHLPDADVIAFPLRYVANEKTVEIDQFSTKRKHLWNGLSYGAAQIAVRKSVILRENITFTDLFGGGCPYSCGEDSKFLVDCYQRGLKVYTYSHLIGSTNKDTSSWFTGYHEKFFYDKGALIAAAYKKWMQYPMILYYTYRFRMRGDLELIKKWKLICAGRREYQNLRSYDEWAACHPQ